MTVEKAPGGQDQTGATTSAPYAAGAPEGAHTVVNSFVRGLTWTGSMKVVSQLVAWCSTLVVARILSPTDYGIMGMASVFLGLLQAVSEFGIGSAVVARRDISQSLIPELNGASIVLGAVGSIVCVSVAPMMGRFYGSDELPRVLSVLSLTFFIGSFRSVPWALLQRDMRFKRLAIYDGAQALILSAASVCLALAGFRYWTLVLAALASTAISTCVAVWFHPVRIGFPHWAKLRKVLQFSGNVVVQRLAWYGYSNSDFIVAGRVLGSSALGTYSMAYELAHMPTNKLAGLLFQLSPATLAALSHDMESLRRFIVRSSEMILLFISPLCVGLASVAPIFVPLVLGEQWIDMIFPLQVLGVYSGATVVLVIPNQTLLVTGQERFGTRYSLAQLAVMPIAFAVGSRWGAPGIALAWPAVHPFLAAMMLRKVFRTVDLSLATFLRSAVLPSASACAAMWTAVLLSRHGLTHWLRGWPLLVALVAIGAVIYAAVLFYLHRDSFDRSIAYIKRLVQSRS